MHFPYPKQVPVAYKGVNFNTPLEIHVSVHISDFHTFLQVGYMRTLPGHEKLHNYAIF